MKTHHFLLSSLTLSLTISIVLSQTHQNQTQPISQKPNFETFLAKLQQWRAFQKSEPKLSPPTVIAAALCFLAASISSAGGIGGGGLFVPILIVVVGLDLQTATSFSAFMVTGGSIANVIYNLFCGKALIDYDIALLSEPCMLLGVSIGVICNLMFPQWLTTILFTVFLAWSTVKTCKNGVMYWNLESETAERSKKSNVLENGTMENEIGGVHSIKEPLLDVGEENDNNNKTMLPWRNLGLLLMIWLSFFFVYVLRGNQYGKSIMPIKHCGLGYWIISSVQIPLAAAFTAWIICRKDCNKYQTPKHQDLENSATHPPPNKLIFPFMALFAGTLGGAFGIGGGMLISPLLLQLGVAPEITAATCSFMVFFSSTMSALQYLLSGIQHVEVALVFSVICFVASLVGLFVVQEMIRKHGRASIIVFSISTVMALSTILVTSFGAVDVWRDYVSGNYMGFNRPC